MKIQAVGGSRMLVNLDYIQGDFNTPKDCNTTIVDKDVLVAAQVTQTEVLQLNVMPVLRCMDSITYESFEVLSGADVVKFAKTVQALGTGIQSIYAFVIN